MAGVKGPRRPNSRACIAGGLGSAGPLHALLGLLAKPLSEVFVLLTR